MDKARKETDKRLARTESELTKIYQKSAKNICTKWNKYMTEATEKLKPLQNEYEQAKLSGNKDLIKETGKKLGKAKKDITIQSQQYQKMLDETSRRLSLVNQTAVAYLNKQIPDIYALNYNSISGDAFKAGVKMGLVDEHTVKRLVSDENIKLPYKKINISKDMRWNTKQLNSAVLQGILQGDSMQKIAERISPIVNNNKNAAIRNARTMVTGAECAGRNDSYKELESRGIVLKKVWIATPDNRTRDSHLELDGEEVDVNEEFSNGCMYPGDPSGDPSEVYNCRCSIRTHIIGFRKADGSISKIDFEREETLHDKQMEGEKERRGIEAKNSEEKSTIVNGKDISATWERRPDKFDFEIEDAVNAQGFDGLPKVVPADEFESLLKEDWNIPMFRVISADTETILNNYVNEYKSGKFFVDCSGGKNAGYGYGMYTVDGRKKTTEQINKSLNTYYKKDRENTTMEMCFTQRPRIITYEELIKIGDQEEYIKYDYGTIATILGYDGYLIEKASGDNYFVLLNRSKTAIKG